MLMLIWAVPFGTASYSPALQLHSFCFGPPGFITSPFPLCYACFTASSVIGIMIKSVNMCDLQGEKLKIIANNVIQLATGKSENERADERGCSSTVARRENRWPRALRPRAVQTPKTSLYRESLTLDHPFFFFFLLSRVLLCRVCSTTILPSSCDTR